MNSETEQFKKRIRELADISYTNSQYLFTDFLTEAEISDLLFLAGSAADRASNGECVVTPEFQSGITLFGGHENAERKIARFGSEEVFAYNEDFHIKVVHIYPRLAKFADAFTHRDFLGAILNLGIDRKVTGDILISNNEAYLFCEEKIADFIKENLDKVRHTFVAAEIIDSVPESIKAKTEDMEFQLNSERIDAIVSHVAKLSRSKASELFRAGKVFVNGRLMENSSFQPKEGDLISIRGFGKIRYQGVNRTTRKGKLNILVSKYV